MSVDTFDNGYIIREVLHELLAQTVEIETLVGSPIRLNVVTKTGITPMRS